jgi:flagellar biosynthetic protein FliR
MRGMNVEWLERLNLAQFLVFALVLLRISGLAMTAPLFGSREVPPRIRALLAASLALIVTPSQLNTALPAPHDMLELGLLAVSEITLGLALGLGVMLLFSGVQLAGQVAAQMAGVQLADVANPNFDTNMPVYSEFLYVIAMLVFFTLGGHRLVVASVLDTFEVAPLGSTHWAEPLGATLQMLTVQSFDLAVRLAAPSAAALLMATLVLGLIGRTLPQLNIMAVGFGINIATALGVLAFTLGALAWAFADRIEPTLLELSDALAS